MLQSFSEVSFFLAMSSAGEQSDRVATAAMALVRAPPVPPPAGPAPSAPPLPVPGDLPDGPPVLSLSRSISHVVGESSVTDTVLSEPGSTRLRLSWECEDPDEVMWFDAEVVPAADVRRRKFRCVPYVCGVFRDA